LRAASGQQQLSSWSTGNDRLANLSRGSGIYQVLGGRQSYITGTVFVNWVEVCQLAQKAIGLRGKTTKRHKSLDDPFAATTSRRGVLLDSPSGCGACCPFNWRWLPPPLRPAILGLYA
jgi:hypothetical protein